MTSRALQAAAVLLAAACGALLVLRHEAAPGSRLGWRASSWSTADGPVDREVVEVRRGQAIEVVVEQRGSDVAVRLRDPSGAVLLERDSPNGTRGEERLLAVAEAAGKFAVEVVLPRRGSLVGYRKRLVAVRAATPADRRLAAAELDFDAGERARKRGDGPGLHAAVGYYRRALRAQLAVPAPAAAARSAARLGLVHASLGEYPQARAAYERALALGLADRDDRLAALNRLGWLHWRLGDPRAAIRTLERSPALAAAAGEPFHAAGAHGHLALAHRALGKLGEAARRLALARELSRAAGAPCGETLALANLGELSIVLGDLPRALAHLREALALECQAPEQLIVLLRSLGIAQARLGDREGARASFRRALALARGRGDRASEAMVLNAYGDLLLLEGQHARARAAQRRALALAAAVRDPRGQAHALASLGRLDVLLGREREALPLLARAEALYARLGERSEIPLTVYGRALAERDLGDLARARASAEEAVGGLDGLRSSVPADRLRSSFTSAVFDPYELAVSLLMRLDRELPGSGFNAAAFAAVERMRARGLFNSAARAAPDPGRIRRELLDEETVLLSYFLGEERSFAWRLDRGGLTGHELPPRGEIEALARQAHRLLVRSAAPPAAAEARALLAEISTRVLAPLAARPFPPRLVVVADGALAAVPFAMLPNPAHPREPLLVRHEIVGLPSAAYLAELRRRPPARGAPDRLIAVVADPVFGRGNAAAAALRAEGELGLGAPPRLPFARVEAERIVALAPPGSCRQLLGRAASRDAVLSGDLEEFRIVHFATHGVAAHDPERSGIVLSGVDAAGAPRAELLRAGELARMKLPAELVVLSACHTAAGEEVRGEGVQSLSRAVLRAGARRVLVSLWAADDEATAELMTHFYRGLFRDGLSPAAALRQAQLAMRRHPRWSAPAYWAGFVLEGEWRGIALP
ncbi:MAG TPA: CHAT domain-containing tetratricopeptide repeat protein [Thermoanaerobaculia bacterium]|nr:CHAT domain-containing tetratricopeptide repeat protein [Thermoanaerobaculia bacterium]